MSHESQLFLAEVKRKQFLFTWTKNNCNSWHIFLNTHSISKLHCSKRVRGTTKLRIACRAGGYAGVCSTPDMPAECNDFLDFPTSISHRYWLWSFRLGLPWFFVPDIFWGTCGSMRCTTYHACLSRIFSIGNNYLKLLLLERLTIKSLYIFFFRPLKWLEGRGVSPNTGDLPGNPILHNESPEQEEERGQFWGRSGTLLPSAVPASDTFLILRTSVTGQYRL